jgi:hypothetical protein
MPSVPRIEKLPRHRLDLILAIALSFVGLAKVAYGEWLDSALSLLVAAACFKDWKWPDALRITLRKAYQPGGEPLICYRVTEDDKSSLYIAAGEEHLFWLTQYDGVSDAATIETLGEVRY